MIETGKAVVTPQLLALSEHTRQTPEFEAPRHCLVIVFRVNSVLGNA